MNCANHSDQATVAFCRTCGKPLCNQCTRDVRGVIYCESCLAARMEGASAVPGTPYIPPPQPTVYPPIAGPSAYIPPPIPPGVPVSSGPNPTVAGILAGFFPFGVGAVYCSQYAKGLSHLVIMVLLIIGVSSDVPWYMHMFLGLGIGFFYVYQIIDAVRTARALQLGEPAPDPFGLGSMFGSNPSPSPAIPGTKTDAKIPVAAVILIGLGVLFLINTAFDFSLHRYWPVILIVLGVYLFAKHWGLLGTYQPGCVCERCRTRKLMGPAMLVTIGILFLLDNVSRIDFGKTWPAILLVIGVVKLMQGNASDSGHVGPLPPGSTGYPPTPPPPTTFQDTPQNPPTPPPSQSIDPSSGEVKSV